MNPLHFLSSHPSAPSSTSRCSTTHPPTAASNSHSPPPSTPPTPPPPPPPPGSLHHFLLAEQKEHTAVASRRPTVPERLFVDINELYDCFRSADVMSLVLPCLTQVISLLSWFKTLWSSFTEMSVTLFFMQRCLLLDKHLHHCVNKHTICTNKI